MIKELTYIFTGADLSGATANIIYLPILKAVMLKKVSIKSDQNVSGANAVFALYKNGVVISGAGVTINVGAKINSVSGLSEALASGDELALNLVSGSISAPLALELEIDDGVTIDTILPSQTGNSGKVLQTNGTAASWQTPSSGGSAADVQVYSTAGAHTWNKPTGAKVVHVFLIGAGGGGGSGRKGAASSTRIGGGGGAGGGACEHKFQAGDLISSVTVTVGAGGTGGASQTTNSTNGNAGGVGGNTTFGSYLRAIGGAAGGLGSTGVINNSAAGAGFPLTQYNGGNGGGNNGGGGNIAGLDAVLGAAGGGSGSMITSSNTTGLSGIGGGGGIPATTSPGLVYTNGGAAASSGTGSTGSNGAVVSTFCGGTGASGGSANLSGNGGAGGNGVRGSGGGGGAAAVDSVGNSGAGGVGGDGYAIVITYF